MKRILVVTLILAVMLGILSCGRQNVPEKAAEEVEKSLLDTISRRGVLKVGLSTFVPWAMNDKNGELIGFEVDVARRLAEDMGVDVEFIPTKWS